MSSIILVSMCLFAIVKLSSVENEFSIELISYTNQKGLRYDQRKKVHCCCDNEKCEQPINMNTCDQNISNCEQPINMNTCDQNISKCEQPMNMNTCDQNISKCDIGLRVCVQICHFYICTSSGLIENNITSFNFSDGNNIGKLNNPMTYRFTERIAPDIFIEIFDYEADDEFLIDILSITNMTHEEMNATCTMSKGMKFESNHQTSTLALRFCFFSDNRNEHGTCSFDGLPTFVYNCNSNIAENLTKDLTPTISYYSSSSLNIHSSDSTIMNATITPISDALCSATSSLIIVFGLISFILLVLCLILFTILLVYCYKYRHMKSSNVISLTPDLGMYTYQSRRSPEEQIYRGSMRSNSGRELPLPPQQTTEINEQVYEHVGSTRHNEDMTLDSNNIIDDLIPTMPLPQVEENDYMIDNTAGEMETDIGYINVDNNIAQDYPRTPSCYEEPISIMKNVSSEN